MEITKKITKKGKYDVIVVGGGIAGVAASVACARNKVSVILIEKGVNLGGLATEGLISWYEPLCDGNGNHIIKGISEELIKLSCKYSFDNLPSEWGGTTKNKKKNNRYSTYYSPGIFSMALDRFALENGVELLFDALVTSTVMEGNVCNGVIVETLNGSEFIEGKMIIDATGSAVVFDRAGAPTVNGENYMTYITHYYEYEDVEKLKETKDTCAFRKWLNSGSDMLGNGHPEGMKKISGVTAEEITDYMICGKKRMLDKISKMDKNMFDIMAVPTMPQLRTIRRIVGNTDFCAVNGLKFEDSIGQCGDFRPKGIGNCYEIPLGSLYNRNYPNLLAAGRIISSPQGDGWEVARVIPVCALTGEAAGKAASICVNKNKNLNELTSEDKKEICIK